MMITHWYSQPWTMTTSLCIVNPCVCSWSQKLAFAAPCIWVADGSYMGRIWVTEWVIDGSQMNHIWFTGWVTDNYGWVIYGSHIVTYGFQWVTNGSHMTRTLVTFSNTTFLIFFSKLTNLWPLSQSCHTSNTKN